MEIDLREFLVIKELMYTMWVIINQLFSALRGLSGNTAYPFSVHLPTL